VVAELDPGQRTEVMVFGTIGFLTGVVDAEAAAGVRRARVFAGYAGWGPGQLETELERDDWIIADSRVDDVFDEDAPTLWSRVLDRQGGQLRLLARMPLDPSLN